MEMQEIKSSNIKAAGYDLDAKKMRVRFGNGTEYDYPVSLEVFNEFIAAKSQGSYFTAVIRGTYTGTKVEESNDE
jgi:hypothetical protein